MLNYYTESSSIFRESVLETAAAAFPTVMGFTATNNLLGVMNGSPASQETNGTSAEKSIYFLCYIRKIKIRQIRE